MNRLRRLGAVVGGLAGLAIGLLFSLFISLLANLGSEALLALTFISGLSAVVGAAVGIGRVDQFDRSVRMLSTLPGRGALRSQPIWPDELEMIGHRLAEIEDERDASLAEQRFVQERLEAIVTGLRDGVIVVGPDLTVVSINQAARAMFQGLTDSALGRPLIEIARDSDLVRIASEAVERRSAQTTPIDYRRAGRQLNVRVLPIRQAGRRLAILVVQDITELRQLENVRRDFVANVSHELRTPLAGIRALVETLVDGAMHDDSVAEDFLHRVVGEVDRLNELIEDLLDLGRLESGRLPLRRSVISAAVLIERAVERSSSHAKLEGAAIHTDGPSEETLLHVDVSRIEQVLTNLLDNAIKFSPRGEMITVRWQPTDAGIEISVTDRGSGILPEDLPRIFERFYKSDRARGTEGTGLGLAIAKHIVAAHGGDLSAASVYGQGSTFTVRLPPAEISADQTEDQERPESHLPEC